MKDRLAEIERESGHGIGDECEVNHDFSNVLTAVPVFIYHGWLSEYTESTKLFGVKSLKYPLITKKAEADIREFVRNGGTIVVDPLTFIAPTVLRPNQFPVGTFYRAWEENHILIDEGGKRIPFLNLLNEIHAEACLNNELGYFNGVTTSVGVVVRSPNPEDNLFASIDHNEWMIAQGRGYVSCEYDSLRIGKWWHYKSKFPDFYKYGGSIDQFSRLLKVEILQAGVTVKEESKVPVGALNPISR